jgi:hypothetical protein
MMASVLIYLGLSGQGLVAKFDVIFQSGRWSATQLRSVERPVYRCCIIDEISALGFQSERETFLNCRAYAMKP